MGKMKFNLMNAMTATTPQTVNVTFDPSARVPVAIRNGDVDVTAAGTVINFALSPAHLPQGATASICGVEFAKPSEPGGTFAPGQVFGAGVNVAMGSNGNHTVYGAATTGGNWSLTDNDNVPNTGSEQDYGYAVWVKVVSGSTETFYVSPDPQIKNKPTTGGGGS